MKRIAFRATRYMLVLSAALGAAACSPAGSPQGKTVAEAYNTSGVVQVTPYTRSIFSSGNF